MLVTELCRTPAGKQAVASRKEVGATSWAFATALLEDGF